MNIDNLKPGDTIEYLLPYTRMQKQMSSDDGKYGTGEFVKIDKKGNIILKNNSGDKSKISKHWVRWNRTEYYKNKERKQQ